MYKANTTFLWYKAGQVIPVKDLELYQKELAYWQREGLIVPINTVSPDAVPAISAELSPDLGSRLDEIKADLMDDGKLNHSNNPAKKSPGRKRSPAKPKR